jgi:prepilin-type N-terminal cleavage/methylation domain-containing protein
MTNSFFPNPQNESGFTIIEMIVVFSIIAILASIGIVASVNYSQAQALEAATQDLKTVLNQARAYAQSQYKPPECNNNALEKYRIDLDKNNNEYTLWVICSGSHSVVEAKLPKDVSFDKNTISSDFFEFPILTGGINGDGASPWTIKLLGAGTKYKIITIEQNGSIR